MADTTYFINGETLTDIANAIRAKDEISTPMTASEMPTRINNISIGLKEYSSLTNDDVNLTTYSSGGTGVVSTTIMNSATSPKVLNPGTSVGASQWITNCTAENIRSGITIAGVTGNYTGDGSTNVYSVWYGGHSDNNIQINSNANIAITDAQVIINNSEAWNLDNININLVTVEPNLIASNIKSGISLFGITGNYSGSGDQSALVYSAYGTSGWVTVNLPNNSYMIRIGASAWSGSLLVNGGTTVNLGLVDNYYVGFYSGSIADYYLSSSSSSFEIYNLS